MRPSRILLALLCACVTSYGWSQSVSLQEQITAQYKTAHIGGDGSLVGDPGTLLLVQRGGIISVPWKALAKCPAKFHDNELHPSTGFCAGMMKNVSGNFKKGEKVYPAKIDIDYKKAKITFQIVRCDACYNDGNPAGMKGEVVFEFPQGYLEKAGAGEVEDTIGKVFSISDNQEAQADDQGQGDQQGNQQEGQQGYPQQQGGGQQGSQQQGYPQQQGPPQDQQQSEPQTVQMGMTTDQVQQVLGKPDKVFNVGTKQIFVYKDVKVTFLNGKVSDVQ